MQFSFLHRIYILVISLLWFSDLYDCAPTGYVSRKDNADIPVIDN